MSHSKRIAFFQRSDDGDRKHFGGQEDVFIDMYVGSSAKNTHDAGYFQSSCREIVFKNDVRKDLKAFTFIGHFQTPEGIMLKRHVVFDNNDGRPGKEMLGSLVEMYTKDEGWKTLNADGCFLLSPFVKAYKYSTYSLD